MYAYKTYGITITIEGHTYAFHVSTEEGVRGLFACVQAPIQDFTVTEEIGRSHRELGFSEIARILSPDYAAA